MIEKKISICIPTYNRAQTFFYSLRSACIACRMAGACSEIVVSDNASNESMAGIVEQMRSLFDDVDIVFHRNSANIGLANNFLEVVQKAHGEFCWIVGDDDFLYPNAVCKMLEAIKNENVDIVICNFDYLFFDDGEMNLDRMLSSGNKFTKREHVPTNSKSSKSLAQFISPVYENVLLGSVMVSCFRKRIWDEVNKEDMCFDGFNSFENIYPHVAIFARGFIDKPAFYCGESLLAVGEGRREWSTETLSFSESTIPIMYTKVFREMIISYEKGGLNRQQIDLCKKWASQLAGSCFYEIVICRLRRIPIREGEHIHLIQIYMYYFLNLDFHKALIKNILRK